MASTCWNIFIEFVIVIVIVSRAQQSAPSTQVAMPNHRVSITYSSHPTHYLLFKVCWMLKSEDSQGFFGLMLRGAQN